MAAWVRRRQGPDVLPATLARRRLYILPTRAGLAFGFLWILMLLAGLNYGNSLALFFTFLLAGFALVAMHECHRNLLGLTLVSVDAPALFAGSAGVLELVLQNEKQLFDVLMLFQQDINDLRHRQTSPNRRLSKG